jgi:AbrB family looped-hinge helix DNA binding protein
MEQHVSTLTRKGQVTVPVGIRALLGVGPHDKVAFVVDGDQVRLIPATSVAARTAGALKSELSMLSAQAEKAAAAEAMAEGSPEGQSSRQRRSTRNA